jgi:phosphatidylglycerol---prolipoprotein diacylglyceryl transferase
MIPYLTVSPVTFGPITLQPFGVLVALGVAIGWKLVSTRAKTLGFVDSDVQSFLWWMIMGGFIGGHLFEAVFYHPRAVMEQPLELLMIWKGLSSFGGFAGATLGGLAWKYLMLRPLRSSGPLSLIALPVRRTEPMTLLPYADVMLAAFPVAWVFGRAGCSVVHDHPGTDAARDSWFAVAYGPGIRIDHGLFQLQYGNTPRYDLGYLEFLFAIVLAIAFAVTWRRAGAKGYYVAAAALVYPPVRFVLDFLRSTEADGGDVRYAGLTPAQWACTLVFAYGCWLLRSIRRTPAAPISN